MKIWGVLFYFFKEPPSYGTYPKQREGTQKWQKAILTPNPKVRVQPEQHLTKLLMPKGDQQPRKGSWGCVLQAHKARKGQEWSGMVMNIYQSIKSSTPAIPLCITCWTGMPRVLQLKQWRGRICSWREMGSLLGKAPLIIPPLIRVYLCDFLSPPSPPPVPLSLSPSWLQSFYFLDLLHHFFPWWSWKQKGSYLPGSHGNPGNSQMYGVFFSLYHIHGFRGLFKG